MLILSKCAYIPFQNTDRSLAAVNKLMKKIPYATTSLDYRAVSCLGYDYEARAVKLNLIDGTHKIQVE